MDYSNSALHYLVISIQFKNFGHVSSFTDFIFLAWCTDNLMCASV
uniref:Uncharacterized protein n=1 Tax=Arundo donax TaxID=35708 RepID=A0A0A9FFZ8_ARUDO